MAQQFNLTAQINLQSPKNVGKVVSDIQRQLKGSGLNTVNIKVKADPRSMAQTNKQLQNVSKNSKAAARDIGNLNRSLQEATRRFSVITLATGTLLSFVTGFKNATKAAIEFERELIKISQVTGKSVSQLSNLTKEVTRLSTSLGASSADLLGVSRTLAQAGFSAEQTRKALDILAKTSLGATFTSIQDTTEGAIALLRQFGKEARSVGGDIKFLEQSLDAINAVSKRFAVESDDLITVIRRVGGVFSTAGGEVNELIALFTSVRSTTRESAETIATGLRTIFTRIQRPETIAQLKELGIQLQDAQGNFVGAFEAVKRLSEGLGTLDPRSAVFSQIVEDLGGFRQIGKVIPLIQQFATAQQALAVAQAGSGSVARDAQKAQAGLGVEIQKVKEEFAALIRQFADSSTFQSVARGALEIARAMIKVAEAVEPLLPLLTSLFALKLGRSLAPGLASLAGVARGGRGGGGAGFSRFARGGMVPGSGNRDTVPAMLTPGEFVIKKSSVKKLGADTLAQMNNNRFNVGGTALRKEFAKTRPGLSTKKLGGEGVPGSIQLIDDIGKASLNADLGTYGGAFLRPIARNRRLQGFVDKKAISAGVKSDADFQKILAISAKTGGGAGKIRAALDTQLKNLEQGSQSPQAGFVLRAGSLEKSKAEGLEDLILGGVEKTVFKAANSISSTLTNRMAGASAGEVAGILKSANIDNVVGNLFEAVLTSLGKKNPAGDRDSSADWDYLSGLGSKLAAFFGLGDVATEPTDAKSSFTSSNVKSFVKKVKNLETKKSIKDINTSLDPILRSIATEISGMSADQSRPIVTGSTRTSPAARGANLAVRDIIGRRGFAKGGSVSDTVPAMLTPGEFVFNRGAAQSIGYDNLKRMNEQGVQGYAAGGIVTTGRAFYGNGPRFSPTQALAGSGMISPKALQSATKELGVFEKILAKLNQIARQLEATFKKADVTVKRTDGDLQKMDVDIKDVAIQLDKEAQEIKESNAARDKEQAAINRSANTRGQRIGGGIQKGAGLVGRAASGAQSAAGSMQSLLFLGAMIGSVTSQMSGLNDATKTAINQTTTMVAVVGGITGTLVDIGASFVLMGVAVANQIGSMITNTGASLLSAGADTAEAGASAAVTAALGPLAIVGIALAAAFTAMLVAVGAVAAGLYFFASKAKAEADEFGKAADKFIQKFEETGQGMTGIVDNLAKQAQGEEDSRRLMATLGSIVGAQRFTGARPEEAKAGEDAGITAAVIAGVGTLMTGAGPIAALGQAAAAFSAGSFFGTKGAVDDPERQAEFEAQVQASVSALVEQLKVQKAMTDAMRTFETQLNDIDMAEALEPEERVSQRLAAQQQFTSGTQGDALFAELIDNVRDAQLRAAAQARGAGRSDLVESISPNGAATFRDGARTAVADVDSLRNLDQEKLEGIVDAPTRAALQTALKNLEIAFDNAAKATAESLKTLSEARQNINIDDAAITSFDNLAKSTDQANKDYIAAIEASKTAIKNESLLREAQLRNELAVTKDQKTRENLTAAIDAEAKRRKTATDRIEESEKKAVNAAIERRDADIAAAIAAEKLRTQLFEAAQALESFKERTQSFVDDRLAIEDQAGIAQGRGSKLTATRLQGVTATTDLNRFQADAQGAISGISDPQQRQQAKRAVDQQVAAGKALQAFADPKAGLLGARNPELFEAGQNENIDQIEKILLKKFQDAGVALPDLSFLGPEIREQVLLDIGKSAGQVGGISQEELDKILKPIQESAAANKEITDEIVKGNQEYLNAYTSYLNEVKRQYEEEVKFRDAVFQQQEQAIDREIRARNIINQSLGRDAVVQDRNAKEARRVQKAQADLTAAGVGVGAGDIAGLTGERQRLAGLAQAQGDQIRGATDDATRTAVAKEQSETLKQLAAVNKELERLANQSGRVDDVFAEMERNAEAIEKERAKREAVTAVVEEFVIGGQDTRQALVEAANGVRKAFATGTLQNQTPEQRQATVGFLDKLADVELLGGFTGREIKQELVFRDAIRMGLDPRIAEQLATATSTEEKLIQANELLAFEINQLSAEMRAAQQGLNPANVAPALVEPQGRARGGLIYRAKGGSIFQPKGTDTVPAMLTPGEFVIRKSAVDAIGADTLAAINGGGGVVYASKGKKILFPRAREKFPVLDPNRQRQRFDVDMGASPDLRLGNFEEKVAKLKQEEDSRVSTEEANASFERSLKSSALFRARIEQRRNEPLPHERIKVQTNQGDAQSFTTTKPDDFVGPLKPDVAVKQRNNLNTRRRARIEAQRKAARTQVTDQQANQARYQRILRTQGPVVAQRFAESQGFTPTGGMGAGTGRGITQAFRNSPNIMGTPQAMRNFQQFQQLQQFLKFQQQQQFRGGARFRAAGGGISGSDTVPAMLTPGEFVMSAGAVSQHGVGTMRALNRGQVKGFNRGGLVGGTQYLQNGGQATGGVDLTKISETFDKITSSINKLSTNLESLNERFGYFEMQHTVMVDGQINLPGIDSSAIAQEITDSIGGLVADEVKKALDNPEARP